MLICTDLSVYNTYMIMNLIMNYEFKFMANLVVYCVVFGVFLVFSVVESLLY